MIITVMAQSVDAHHLGGLAMPMNLREFIDRAEFRLEQHVPHCAHRYQGGHMGKKNAVLYTTIPFILEFNSSR